MFSLILPTAALLGAHLFGAASAQTWCGKYYQQGDAIVPPGGNFPIPAYSSDPLFTLRCSAAWKPYLESDASSPAAFLIDAQLVNYEIEGAAPITLPEYYEFGLLDDLVVTVSYNGKTVAEGLVPFNASGYELPFTLYEFQPQTASYNLDCSASYTSAASVFSAPTTQTFTSTLALSYLPEPTESGSTVKMDLRTGALWAKPATGLGGDYAPVFPIGFYTSFDGYLATNLSNINLLKEQGFTVIHPVPTFDNLTALYEVIERMQEVGMYLMYDMRFTYMNLTSVTEQVNSIKGYPNVLLWYTGDEPDGTSDPLNATRTAYDLIYELDGYRPVSLVLNCQDYYWSSYTNGTDIVMQDVYMVSNNVSWSNEWDTACTPDFGCCGCDNCAGYDDGIGSFLDISDRVTSFKNRLEVMGWERTKSVITVPQAFGGEEYWLRPPTGAEWVVENVMGINHGALGSVGWDDPTTTEIKAAASAFALTLPSFTSFLFNPSSVIKNYAVGPVDVATWSVNGQTLLMAANTAYINATVTWGQVGLSLGWEGVYGVDTKFVSGENGTVGLSETGLEFAPVGAGVFIL